MCFNFLSIAALVSVATSVSTQAGFCPEALHFGSVIVSLTTLSPGESFTVTANLTCAVELGDTPTFLDYYINGVSEANIGGPILIVRRTYDATTMPPADQFTAVLPAWFYNTDAQYSLRMDNSFAKPGPTGESVITVGGVSTGITITGL
ncbi:hypothetical protein B0H17DRAFT_1193367 [Mycena rosella]|uniref:Spore coat protein U domain-containing protein n=1 Tax=Mycena rosella TaxID=1033263 RepID=A0AAD7GTD9_MYCRO|nr:hypothetical protein B0H17DRAFT_1193367 [Mycena rosella]